MSDEDPKDTATVTDIREEDVFTAVLIVRQAARDVLNVSQKKRAVNKVKNQATSDVLDVTQTMSTSNEVKNQATSGNSNADTRGRCGSSSVECCSSHM
jgi:hypothetical protein